MAKKKGKKRSKAKRYISDVMGEKYLARKKLRHFNWPLVLILLTATALAFILQYVCLRLFAPSVAITNAYIVFVAVCGAGFLLLNRGFRRGSTPVEKLPQSWSAEQKTDYLEKEKSLQKIARILLVVMLPFLFVLIFDYVLIMFGVA